MPKGGHNKKPTQQKILQGTFRRGRAPKNEPKPQLVNEVPAPPENLPAAGKRLWKKQAPALVRAKLLTVADLAAFELLCSAYGRYREMDAAIRRGGRTYSEYFRGKTAQTVPEWMTLKESFAQCVSLFPQFGMTPAARSRIEIPEKEPEKKDPMESLLDAK